MMTKVPMIPIHLRGDVLERDADDLLDGQDLSSSKISVSHKIILTNYSGAKLESVQTKVHGLMRHPCNLRPTFSRAILKPSLMAHQSSILGTDSV